MKGNDGSQLISFVEREKNTNLGLAMKLTRNERVSIIFASQKEPNAKYARNSPASYLSIVRVGGKKLK